MYGTVCAHARTRRGLPFTSCFLARCDICELERFLDITEGKKAVGRNLSDTIVKCVLSRTELYGADGWMDTVLRQRNATQRLSETVGKM